jgi:DNA-directed RNA polymerase specialized sigma24 family protein
MAGFRDPRIRDMDNEALLEYGAFFRAEFAPVLRIIALMLRDHGRAEEISQDAFLQLLLHWPKASRYESYNALGFTECPRTIRNAWLDATSGPPVDTSCLASIAALRLAP